ncbi:O-antigen ligase family protein [Leptothrix discophora]|uniref:O-antigen ligase family protein n=1 Tax=Leptothrix discophora TaxID=89 RepID=UPI002737C991|nr:O-antigen ligase family protein [Leptothrix discophora]
MIVIALIAVAFALVAFIATGTVLSKMMWILVIASASPLFDLFGSEDGLSKQILWASLFSICVVYIFFGAKRQSVKLGLVELPFWLGLLCLYAVLTIAWSPIPVTSIKRFIQFLGIIIVGIAIIRYESSTPLHVRLLIPCALLMVIGLIVGYLTQKIWPLGGVALTGLASHKNQWGLFLLVTSTLAVSAVLCRKMVKVSVLVLAVSIYSILLTKSATALVGLLVLLSIVCVLYLGRGLGSSADKTLIALFLFFLLVALPLSVYVVRMGVLPIDAAIETFFSSTGRDSSLTGRDNLWRLMRIEIAKHAFFGVGYGGFWTGISEGPSNAVTNQIFWGVPVQAHNGYLDFVNELGVVGMSLFVALIAWYLRVVWLLSRRCDKSIWLFPALYLVIFLVTNTTETTLLRPTHFLWIVFVICCVYLKVGLLRLREVAS